MDGKAKYSVIASSAVDIKKHIERSNDPKYIAKELFNAKILSLKEYEKVSKESNSKQIARDLKLALMLQVQNNCDNFEKIVEIFRKTNLSDLAESLEQKLLREKQKSGSSHDSSGPLRRMETNSSSSNSDVKADFSQCFISRNRQSSHHSIEPLAQHPCTASVSSSIPSDIDVDSAVGPHLLRNPFSPKADSVVPLSAISGNIADQDTTLTSEVKRKHQSRRKSAPLEQRVAPPRNRLIYELVISNIPEQTVCPGTAEYASEASSSPFSIDDKAMSNIQEQIVCPGTIESASEASSSPFSVDDNKAMLSSSPCKPIFNHPDEMAGSDVEIDFGTSAGENGTANSNVSDRAIKRKLESEIEVPLKKFKSFPAKRDSVPESIAVQIFRRVSKYWSLGSVLGLPYTVTDEIESSYLQHEHAMQVAQACLKRGLRYEDLYNALQSAAVQDEGAAKDVKQECPAVSTLRTSSDSSDISIDGVCSKSTESDTSFTEANVLQVVENVSEIYELGINLGLGDGTMQEVKKYALLHQSQKLVSRLFRIKTESELNWKFLYDAIAQTKKGGMSYLTSMAETKAMELIESDDTAIKTKYGILMASIQEELEKKREADKDLKKKDIMKEIKQYIRVLYPGEDVSSEILEGDTIDQIFDKLHTYNMWNYSTTSKLFSVAKRFLPDNENIKDEIKEYRKSYLAHKKCTLIGKWLSENPHINISSLENPPADIFSLDPTCFKRSIRKEFSWKFFESEKVLRQSLKYLSEVWEELPSDFGELDPVLHKIREGCIEVVWYIPSALAQMFLNDIQLAANCFTKFHISALYLESASIFENTKGTVSEKEKNELHLLLAVQDKDVKRTESYIEHSTCINRPWSEMKRTLLMIASHSGCTKIVSTLLEHKAEVNQQDGSGWTALAYAAVQREMDVINILLENKADISIPSKNPGDITVLDLMKKLNKNDVYEFLLEQYFIKSAKHGDINAVQKMLKLLGNIEAIEKDEHGWNPNILDLIKFDKKEIRDLLKDGLNQNMIKDAKDGNADSVKAALKMGADVEALDKVKEGWVALAWASCRGHLDAVDHLLGSKANPNVQCGECKWSPLILASRNGHVEIVKRLLHNGASLEQSTLKGWSPLRFAAAFERVEVGKILIDSKADVNSIDDENGYNPLSQAAQDGKADFISMLIQKVPDLDLNFSTEKGGGWTPLMLACKNGHTDAVRLLLLNDAKVNLQKKDNVAAIHVASFAGNDKVVESLVRFGADVNVADEWGVTSLMFAAKEGHVGVVKALNINKNLDFNLQEGEAKFSAPFFAIQCKHFDVLKELMRSEKVDCKKTDLHGKTLWKLIEKTKFEDAKTLFEETYPEEMNVMMSMIAKPSPPQAAAMEGPLPTVKSMLDSHSSDLYIQNMLNGIDNRMKKRAAGAA